jgi:hypothetical protein
LIGGELVAFFFRRVRTNGRPLLVISHAGDDADAILKFLMEEGYVMDKEFTAPIDQHGPQRVGTQLIQVAFH